MSNETDPEVLEGSRFPPWINYGVYMLSVVTTWWFVEQGGLPDWKETVVEIVVATAAIIIWILGTRYVLRLEPLGLSIVAAFGRKLHIRYSDLESVQHLGAREGQLRLKTISGRVLVVHARSRLGRERLQTGSARIRAHMKAAQESNPR